MGQVRATAICTTDGMRGYLSLARAEKCNALDVAMADEVSAAVKLIAAQNVRVALLEAQGDYFCSGVDIVETKCKPQQIRIRAKSVLSDLLASPALWIAAITGPVLGFGIALTSVCPVAIASEDSWFCMPEIRLGKFPQELLAYLTALLGARRAFELALTGRRLAADEAYACGLVSEVLPRTRVGPRCEELMANFLAAPDMADQARGAWQARFVGTASASMSSIRSNTI